MTKIFKKIRQLPEFEKEFDKLQNKYRTIEDDLDNFINTGLKLYHKLNIDNKGIFPIPKLGIKYPQIYKVKKFTCKYLKGKGVHSGIRIIYAYYSKDDIIEFIEIYYKKKKSTMENRDRIHRYYGKKD